MVALSVNPTSATAYLCQSSGITSNTNTVDMGDGFVIEDADGTEVTITEIKN